jgi:hypothetical protein
MSILKKRMGESEWLMLFMKMTLCYSIFTTYSCYEYHNSDNNYMISGKIVRKKYIEYDKVDNLEEKLILDLSTLDVLSLVNKDLLVNISLDVEGKIIGYRPVISRMPSYWNSEITKKFLIKNNLFSISYEKDQVISFRLSSL